MVREHEKTKVGVKDFENLKAIVFDESRSVPRNEFVDLKAEIA